MIHACIQMLTYAVVIALVVSSVALAGRTDTSLSEERFEGTVTRVDTKGGATVTTTEGKEYNIQGTGLQVGEKIACGRHGDGLCETIPAKPQ